MSDVMTAENEERLPPVHPGEVLLEDFMQPLGLSQYRLAHDLGVPAMRISQIVHGKRAVTADTALRLARYFGTSANVWMRLQARYDLEVAEVDLAERVQREVKVVGAARSLMLLRFQNGAENALFLGLKPQADTENRLKPGWSHGFQCVSTHFAYQQMVSTICDPPNQRLATNS
jgi:addiction module HigA family antidote